MKDDLVGCGGMAIVLALVLLAGIWLVGGTVDRALDSRVAQVRAEAALERARMERDRQESLDWQREFSLVTTTMMIAVGGNTAWVAVLSGALGAGAAGAIIHLLDKKKLF